jgi:spore maturation protein SpmA
MAVSAQDTAGSVKADSTVHKPTPRRETIIAARKATDDSLMQPLMDSSGKAPIHIPSAIPLAAFPSEKGAPTAYGERMTGVFRNHPWCNVLAPATRVRMLERQRAPTDWVFYLFSFLCLFLGFIRIAFPKYLQDLFRVFFNTSLRGKQIREQLLMDRLPSLLLNIFFLLSGGSFLYFLLRYLDYFGEHGYLMSLGACMAGLALLYVGKYVVTELAGLIFDRRQAAEIYSFVVFMVIKVAGIWLLPAGLLLAFSPKATQHTVIVFALGGLAILLLYRLNREWQVLHNILKINYLQYAIFVVAFEVVPVMMIYKVLLRFF